MVLNLIGVALIILIAYMWSIRGFFSAFLHMVCVIVAGAIAFGFWEPTSIWLLNHSPDKGLLSVVGSNAWGLGLLIPFVIGLVVTRVAMDKLVPANVAQATVVNYVGGGACGAVSGVLTVGVLVIALGAFRFGDSTMGMGYRPVWYTAERATGGGSLVLNDSMWIPADRMTAKFYSHLSQAAFFASEPMAKWHPEAAIEGPAARITYNDGGARNTLKPKDVELKGVYQVGADEGSKAQELLSYDGGASVQKYVDIHGEPVLQGRLFGVKFELKPGAKETTAQHMVSPGQLRLVVEPTDSSGRATDEASEDIFPVALISQAEASDASSYGRWRFDAEGVHISSVGGAASSVMAAEFLVPPNRRPIALYVKNVRLKLSSEDLANATKFASVGMRDAQVASGNILSGEKATNLDRSSAVTVSAESLNGRRGDEGPISISSKIGRREAFQTSQKRGLSLDEKNNITSGSGTWAPEELNARYIEPNLKVDEFAVPEGTVMLQVDVSPKSAASLLGTVGQNSQPTDPFYLIDSQGTKYQAVGYVYKDRQRLDIRYFPGNPLAGSKDIDAPGLTSVRDDQELRLLFLVSQHVELTSFAIGNSVVVELDSPRVLGE